LTAGASTPNSIVGEVIERLDMLAGAVGSSGPPGRKREPLPRRNS
jgi:hypothetical protein